MKQGALPRSLPPCFTRRRIPEEAAKKERELLLARDQVDELAAVGMVFAFSALQHPFGAPPLTAVRSPHVGRVVDVGWE